MDEEKHNTGSIFDAIDAASEVSAQNASFPNVNEIEVEDTSTKTENPVSAFSDDLNSEPFTSTEDVKPFESNETKNEAQQKAFTTVNKNEDDIKPFDPQKMSAKDAMGMNGNKKPPVLNKQYILYCLVGILAFLVIFALFIFPEITKSHEKNKVSKPVATENTVPDYSSLVGKSDAPNEPVNEVNQKTESEEDIIANLPPVNGKYTYKEPVEQNVNYGGGTVSTYEVPNTRKDALQAKTINGIKGISSTQKNYLTPDNASVPYNNTNPKVTFDNTAETTSTNPYSKFGLPDQSTYTKQLLNQYANNNNTYAQQNDQSGKNTFYNQNRGVVSGQWLPLNSIWQGTIFDVTLTSDICTDLPGECTAVVTKNVYSSQDGRYLLIPQNSKLLGSYNSSITYSQKRVQVGWHTLIRPDGYMVNLGNFNATDAKGASGIKGSINDHPWAYLKAIVLMSAVNIVNSELQATAASSTNRYVQNVMANSQEVATTLGKKLIDRAMDVQPTITIKAGTIINIVANTNLELPVLEPWEVTQPYHKK